MDRSNKCIISDSWKTLRVVNTLITFVKGLRLWILRIFSVFDFGPVALKRAYNPVNFGLLRLKSVLTGSITKIVCVKAGLRAFVVFTKRLSKSFCRYSVVLSVVSF